MARNRVSSIQASVANSIPNLTNLVLTANNFAELADLDLLSKFTKLTHLTLMENPVARKEVRLLSPKLQAHYGYIYRIEFGSADLV